MNQISASLIKDFYHNFHKIKSNIIAKNAITSSSLEDVALNRDLVQSINDTFYKEIDIETEITNQQNSGRCWIYSFLNVIRLYMIKKYKLDEDFEFSQNYLMFWDKLEKSNMFLHNIYKSCHCQLDSRLVTILLKEPTSDGGQWNMLINLVNKYGLIPKNQMEDTIQSANTDKMNSFINDKLIQFAEQIRNFGENEKKNKNKIFKKMLYQIYTILVMFLGCPPKTFTWKYYSSSNLKKSKKKKIKMNKNKKSQIQRVANQINPLRFYQKCVPYNSDRKVVLINAPLKSKPFYNIYNIEYFNNMVGGVETKYVNIPIQPFIEATKKSIDNNEAVWFGCDVSKYSNDELGLFNEKVYDYKSIFDFEIELEKGKALEYYQSVLNHAMIIRGYDLDKNGNITQWLVENSWGDNIGKNGYYIMSHQWFKRYVYQVIIDEKYLDKKTHKVLVKTPIICPLWDPFGALAIK